MAKLYIEALSLDYGKTFGYQEYLLNILKYIKLNRSKLRHEQIILLCKSQDISVFKIFEPEISIKNFNTSNKYHKYIIINTLNRHVNIDRQDVILFTNNYSALTKFCKYILVIHDLLYLRKEYIPNRSFRWQRRIFIPRSIKLADRIVAISQFVHNDIIESFRIKEPNKIHTIYNYFNFRKFDTTSEPDFQKDDLEFKYFLGVSSNAFHKNSATIIKAFAQFSEIDKEYHLVMVGHLNNSLKNIYQSLPVYQQQRIHFRSNLSNIDLGNLYKHASAYISATLFEGLGMPIIEAMYHDLPIIVSDIPVCREVTQNLGIYFNPLFPEELFFCMKKVVDNNVKASSKKIIQSTFSTENTVQKYIELINQLH